MSPVQVRFPASYGQRPKSENAFRSFYRSMCRSLVLAIVSAAILKVSRVTNGQERSLKDCHESFYTTLATWSRQLMQMPGNEYSYQPDEFPTCRVVDFRTHKRDQEKHPLLQSLCSQTDSTRLRFHFTRSGTQISCQCALAVWAFTTVPERRTCLLSNMDRLCGTT